MEIIEKSSKLVSIKNEIRNHVYLGVGAQCKVSSNGRNKKFVITFVLGVPSVIFLCMYFI